MQRLERDGPLVPDVHSGERAATAALAGAVSSAPAAVGGVRRLAAYLLAAGLVRLADEGARVALVLLAIQRTGSAGIGGALIAALLVPHVVAAPVVGLLVDRIRQPRAVLAPAALAFALSLASAAAGLGSVPLPLMIGVLLAGGCCGPALTGALTSQLSGLMRQSQLPRSFGLDSLTYNVAGIAGPALTAVLAGSLGARAATGALALSAALGAFALAVLPIRGKGGEAGPAVAPPLTAGLQAVRRDRVLAVVTVASSVGQLGMGALPVIAAVLASRLDSPAKTGVLMAAVAAGALAGSLGWTLRPMPTRHAPLVVMVALIGCGAPLAVASSTGSLSVVVVLFGICGLSTGPFASALFTARQDRAPQQLRAQVFSIGAGLKTSTAAAGAALAGLLANSGTSTLLLLAGSCPLLAGGFGLWAMTKPHYLPPSRISGPRPPGTSRRRRRAG
jgi:MFS family permease